MWWKRKRTQKSSSRSQRLSNGVFLDHERHIISLRQHTINIELDKKDLVSVRTLFVSHTRALAVVALISVCIVAILYAHVAKAEAVLYPRTCLGGWKNPGNAAGMPDVSDYSDDNSASVSDTLADLFCGDFQGDTPKDTKPTAITVKISWAIAPKAAPEQVSATLFDLASSTSAVLEAAADAVGVVATSSETAAAATVFSTSTDATTMENAAPPAEASPTAPSESAPPPDPLPEPVIVPVENPFPSPAGIPAITPTPADVPTSAPPAEAPPPSADTAPQSSLPWRILAWLSPSFAYAEEETFASSTIDAVIGVEAATTTTATSTITSTEAATSTPALIEDAVLEVSYTLDGSTWRVLGTVTRVTLSRSSFALPIGDILRWSDLERMQIRIRSLSSISELGTIYVDGMTLSATYENVLAEKNKDDEQSVGQGSFQRSSPDFEVTNPVAVNIPFDPSPCTGAYWGFYWFADGPTPYAFADISTADIGKDVSIQWPHTAPFIELAGVIISDKPFAMTKLELDAADSLGVAWPEDSHICTPQQNPLVGSSNNPAERFHIRATDGAIQQP